MLTRALAVSLVSGSCFAASALAGPDCGIFVSPSGADVPGGGLSSDDPVATIGFAMTRAQQEGLACVFLQAGTYTEVVTPIAAVTIDGGYGVSWERDAYTAPGHEVRIVGAADKGTGQFVGVVVEGIAGTVTLSNLVVEAPDAMGTTGGNGLSSYGVYGLNSTVVMLEDVRIECGDGAHGEDGADGASASQTAANSGQNGQAGGSILGVCSTFESNGGARGIGVSNGGSGGRGGAQDTDCSFPFDNDATNGLSGVNGEGSGGGFGAGGAGGGECNTGGDGQDGRVTDGNGGGGGVDGSLVGNVWRSTNGTPGTLGQDGSGGGGGGGGGGCDTGTDTHGGGGGGGGAGGRRAITAGNGGNGGGGSFGVFAVNTDVALLNVDIDLGIGGNGGDGGDGGAGQPGGAGGAGGAPLDGSDAGGDGGDGGRGGHSGGGGGASGGPAVGVFVDGGALTPIGVSYTGGTGGDGGAGGIGVNSATDGDPGVVGNVFETRVSARGATSVGDPAALLANRLASRGGGCDIAPCVGMQTCDADLDNDGVVGSGDLAILLAAWGPCP